MLSLLALATFVTLVNSQGFPEELCCLPRYEGIVTELGLEGQILGAPTNFYNAFKVYYDFPTRQVAAEYIDYPGITNPDQRAWAYYNYNNETVHYLNIDGTCEKLNWFGRMRRPCELNASDRISYYYMGYEDGVHPAFTNWMQLEDNNALFNQFDVYSYECSLLFSHIYVENEILSQYGSYAQNYVNVTRGITDPSVFDLPLACQDL